MGASHLHDAVETRLEAAQVLLLHLNLLEDLLLAGQALSVLLCQPVEGGQSIVLGCPPRDTPTHLFTDRLYPMTTVMMNC